MDKQFHWDQVYQTKEPHQVGWTQKYPEDSMKRIMSLDLPKDAPIIDIGGGDSDIPKLLLEEGFSDITVLDISSSAIERAQKKLGNDARKINWVVSDIKEFKPPRSYVLWHDRAAFHFLISPSEINSYINLLKSSASDYIVIGTFSDIGPNKCSGLPITQYDEQKMEETLAKANFTITESERPVHITPSGGEQAYLFVTATKEAL
jgi:ribosomal protein L24E